MRVRINYAVDLEELLSECSRLLYEAKIKLQHQLNTLDRASEDLDDNTILNTLTQIDLTRQEISKYDQRLEDTFALLRGYYDLLNEQQQEVPSANEETQDG